MAGYLKPHTVGVPIWRDDEREYLEIAVLSVTLRPSVPPASVARLTELLHRAVPYPVLLLLDAPHGLTLSAAHKRWAHNEEGKVVLDGDVLAAALTGAALRVTAIFCTPSPCSASRKRICWRCTKAGWPACWPCRWRTIPVSFYAKTACSPCQISASSYKNTSICWRTPRACAAKRARPNKWRSRSN